MDVPSRTFGLEDDRREISSSSGVLVRVIRDQITAK
jgi:hypothetical protein